MLDYLGICCCIIRKIEVVLTNESFMSLFKEKNRFVRKRQLSLQQMVLYLLYSSKASMYLNTSLIRKELSKLHFPDVSKQAVSKARQHILPECFLALQRVCVEKYYHRLGKLRNTWRGFRVFAVDGSKIEVPDTPENLRVFGSLPVSRRTKEHAMALLSTLYDVLEDIIVDGKLFPYGYSERQAAKEHLQRLKALSLSGKLLVIFDRGYTASWLYEEAERLGLYYLVRCKIGCCAGRDSRRDFIKEVRRNGHTIKVRYIHVSLNTGEEELLATNIMDSSLSEEDFRKLYFLRWGIESKYREAKEQMLLEEFTGKTARAVEQDMYINFLYMNLCSIVKHAADEQIAIRCRPDNRFRYQANRSFLIGRIRKLLPKLLLYGRIRKELDELCEEAVRRRSQIQPDRKCERRKKPPQRKHFSNRKTTT